VGNKVFRLTRVVHVTVVLTSTMPQWYQRVQAYTGALTMNYLDSSDVTVGAPTRKTAANFRLHSSVFLEWSEVG
jgi:hypothetical protein